MVKAKCQRTGCAWESEECPGELAAVYLKDHLEVEHPRMAPPKAPKLPQPRVRNRIEEDIWEGFVKEWGRFKLASNITENSNVFLLSCCETELKENVLREYPDVTDKTEAVVLETIKKHAVVKIATSALTTELFAMRQDHSEPVRSFAARQKGKARSCKLTQTCANCTHEVDFSDRVVKAVLLNGLADEDVKREVLGDSSLDEKTLEETVKLVEAKEAALRSVSGGKPDQSSGVTGFQKWKKIAATDKRLQEKGKCDSCKDGNLDTDAVMRGLLLMRNQPERDTGMSPAMVLMGRQLRDSLPLKPPFERRSSIFDKDSPLAKPWKDMWRAKEEALSTRLMRNMEKLDANSKKLPALKPGDKVRVQNQTGNNPGKWNRTGVVVQVGEHDQHIIRMDGSRRLTKRNRRFLRRFDSYEPMKKMPPPEMEAPWNNEHQGRSGQTLVPNRSQLQPQGYREAQQEEHEVEPRHQHLNHGGEFIPEDAQNPETWQGHHREETPQNPSEDKQGEDESAETRSPSRKGSRLLKQLEDFNKKGISEAPVEGKRERKMPERL